MNNQADTELSYIGQCIKNFRPAPRRFGMIDRYGYMRLPRPEWLKQDPQDKLVSLFDRADRLWRDGVVTWGAVIQANSQMWSPGDSDCPGELLYSTENPDAVDPEYLHEVANALYDLKGKQPENPELAPIADYLTDELVRVFGLKVPSYASPLHQCMISTSMFFRKHLPGGYLHKAVMPIVVHPKSPYIVSPLPERYWPQELLEWWER